jgi:anti-sigma-K factor RskA
MTTADAHTLTAAYALDALDATDRAAAEKHIAACEACAAEAGRLSRAAASLAQLTAETPPPGLRDSVLSAISVTRQLPPVAPPTVAPVAPAARPARVIAAVAAAAVIACGVIGGVAIDQHHQLTAARARTEQARALATAALDAADSTSTALRGGGTLRTAGAGRTAGAERIAVVSARDLPGLRDGRTYQLWLISAAGPRSAGLVDGRAGSGTWLLDDLRGARTVALTVEPPGGSPAPTTSPLGATPLPA